MQTYTVGRLAARFGLSRSALLHYDAVGLLRPLPRADGEYRRYGPREVERLERICTLRRAGMGLESISWVLDGGKDRLSKALERRLAEVDREMAALREQQRVVVGLLSRRPEKDATPLNRRSWTRLMRDAGFDHHDMRKWHQTFERTNPAGHEEFLRLLGIADDQARRIRQWARSGPGKKGPQAR